MTTPPLDHEAAKLDELERNIGRAFADPWSDDDLRWLIARARATARSEAKAAQFESDWVAAKYEFGVALRKAVDEKNDAIARADRLATELDELKRGYLDLDARAEKAERENAELRQALFVADADLEKTR